MIGEAYVGYKLTPEARGALLRAFPPHYENVVAHHVTTDFLGNRTTAFLPPHGKVTVVGHAHDPERGIHAAVVHVGRLTHQGMDPERLLHITISHRTGASPVHANDAIRKHWQPVKPFEIDAKPFFGEARDGPAARGGDSLHRYDPNPRRERGPKQRRAAPDGVRVDVYTPPEERSPDHRDPGPNLRRFRQQEGRADALIRRALRGYNPEP